MKKLMFAAVAALAMVGAANAAQSYEISAVGWVSPYATYDTDPGDGHAGWYSCYVMKQEDAQTAMGCVGTTVSYSTLANWLGANFAANKASVIANAELISYQQYSTSWNQYQFYNGSAGTSAYLNQALGVAFYDDGGNVAYKVMSNSFDHKFQVDDTSNATAWTAATTGGVPEPTSGLLLLLGVAGLCLRRKQK